MADNGNAQIQTGSIGFGGALFIVFLVLKLTDHIGWSWWWVTSPLWIPFGLSVAIMIIAFVIAIIASALDR